MSPLNNSIEILAENDKICKLINNNLYSQHNQSIYLPLWVFRAVTALTPAKKNVVTQMTPGRFTVILSHRTMVLHVAALTPDTICLILCPLGGATGHREEFQRPLKLDLMSNTFLFYDHFHVLLSGGTQHPADRGPTVKGYCSHGRGGHGLQQCLLGSQNVP